MALACGKWAGLLCDPASQVVFKDVVIDPEEALRDEVVIRFGHDFAVYGKRGNG